MKRAELSEALVNDFVEKPMGDHVFAKWLRNLDPDWTYEQFKQPPGTYYFARGKIVAVVFYNNTESTHRIFVKRELVDPIDELRSKALQACNHRGHVMGWDTPGRYENRTTQIGHCFKCGKEVIIDTKPEPNGIDIGGEAVALNCED